jgi:hypothetical protein
LLDDQRDATEETQGKAEKRESNIIGDREYTIFEGEIPIAGPKLGPEGAEAAGPYMKHRLRKRANFWEDLGANAMVMNWVRHGFKAWFSEEPACRRKANQESCHEPEAHSQFITASVEALLARGVIGEWDPQWGAPRVISPLKVVPKKGNKYRLILDLSWLNKHLTFPKFKYDSVKQIADLFEPGDYMFAWDAKDGYWHVDLHEDMWQYMCFEWKGKTFYFGQMPFGLAPACWVFTRMMRVSIDHLRMQGLKVLSYIDDGLAAANLKSEASRLRQLTIDTLIGCGWLLNWAKSDLNLSQKDKEFIGYLISTQGAGSLQPSEARCNKLLTAVSLALKARTITPRKVAQAVGHIVSLRPCLDPMALLFTKQLNIWIQTAVDVSNWDWRTQLSEGARHELKIWKGWFQHWKSRPLWPQGDPELLMAQDAGEQGVGGWLGVFNGVSRMSDHKGRNHIVGEVLLEEGVLEAAGRLARQDLILSSTYRELYALFFMVNTFKDILAGRWVRIQADNRSLFYIASKGSSSCTQIHSLLVRLFWLCAEHNIKWDILWLPRELNEWADRLSKDLDEDDWSLQPRFWAVIQARFGPHSCDMFASDENALVEQFCSYYWCPGVAYVDCFSGNWSTGNLWWHPNPRDVGTILKKVQRDRAKGSLLLPIWPRALWWRTLCPDGRHFDNVVIDWLRLPRRGAILKGRGTGLWNREVPRTDIIVVQLDGSGLGLFKGSPFCAADGCVDCRPH